MNPTAFRARTHSRANSRLLPYLCIFRVNANVQGNAIGKIWTPLSFQ